MRWVPEGPEGLAAVPVGGGGAWPGFETTRQATRRHRKRRRCGGRRRDRRARAGFEAGPGCGARGRWRGLAGIFTATRPHWCGGRRRARRARAGFEAGPGCGARGRWRGLAGLRDDAPSEARGADGSRAGRRPRAHQAARPRACGNPAPQMRDGVSPTQSGGEV